MSGASAAARTTIVLLAGGSATRLPGKLSLAIEGEPMLVRVYRRLVDGRRPCVVSARGPLEPSLAAKVDAPIIFDDLADAGPLGAIVTVASTLSTPLFFAAAGDLPDLDASFVDDLERAYDARLGEQPEAVVPVWSNGDIEPLAALYATSAVVRAGSVVLASGRRRVSAMIDSLRVLRFAVRPQDEARLANVNTRPDYEVFRP
ncbi:MAG TPA: molybdenum cofactor guanylyltransferase [Candidatus Eremiobacteraceae bacterium]|nr:molybdenum cofactor guanylyltransferase [Candidatus Eremiobacteraceae bacterium]